MGSIPTTLHFTTEIKKKKLTQRMYIFKIYMISLYKTMKKHDKLVSADQQQNM